MLWSEEIKLGKVGEKRKCTVLKIRLRTVELYSVISRKTLQVSESLSSLSQ